MKGRFAEPFNANFSHAISAPVVLVPISASIESECEDSRRELEWRGVPVRKLRGFTPIDVARNWMAAGVAGSETTGPAGFLEYLS